MAYSLIAYLGILFLLTILTICCSYTRYRKYVAMAEVVLFFLGVPFSLLFFQVHSFIGIVIIINFCCLCLFVIYLLHHAQDSVTHPLNMLTRERLQTQLASLDWRRFGKVLGLRIIFLLATMSALTLMLTPERFIVNLTTHPFRWMAYWFCYSIFSAFPQEFVYRVFFFARYRLLFAVEEHLIWASSLTFAFSHIIYANYVSVILTLLGGYIITKEYARHRSLLFASIEHAVYGGLIFTLGLDKFFGAS